MGERHVGHGFRERPKIDVLGARVGTRCACGSGRQQGRNSQETRRVDGGPPGLLGGCVCLRGRPGCCSGGDPLGFRQLDPAEVRAGEDWKTGRLADWT